MMWSVYLLPREVRNGGIGNYESSLRREVKSLEVLELRSKGQTLIEKISPSG